MDTRSVTRLPLPSTRVVVAGAHLCDQVSALLLIEAKTVRQAFLGEPVEEVRAMVKRALKHEGEAEFDAERILPAWAQKRGRGYWRMEDRRVEECGHCHGTGWAPGPFRTADEWSEEREGVECPRCKGSEIALKALQLLSEGKTNYLMAPFPLGRVVATPGVLTLLEEADEDPLRYLNRHRSGDREELDAYDVPSHLVGITGCHRSLSFLAPETAGHPDHCPFDSSFRLS